jgi:hypothetical protein
VARLKDFFDRIAQNMSGHCGRTKFGEFGKNFLAF